MERRDFLKNAGLGSAAIVLPKPVIQAETNLKPRIKLSVSSFSYWHFKGDKFPIEKVIDDAARMGLDGIDILHRQMEGEDNAYIQKLKRHAFENGIALTCLSIHQGFVYPDAVVICEKPLFYQNRVDTILNPLLVVEVLSPSTEDYDRGEKFYLYRSLASFKEYVVIHQNHTLVSAYFRLNEKDWRTDDVANLSESIHLQSVNIKLKLSDIYRGIEMSSR